MKTIVFATTNQGKVKEIKELLKDMPVNVLTMEEAGIDIDVEETGTSFKENAILKAETLTAYTDAIVLADDSGLEIDCLNREPGVYSARYLGKDTPYKEKNAIILNRLKDVPLEQRTARYVCAIAAASKDFSTLVTQATMEGYIGYEARGKNGFGYDPIFFVEAYQTSTAELAPELKNQISHRGKALRFMKEKLKAMIGE